MLGYGSSTWATMWCWLYDGSLVLYFCMYACNPESQGLQNGLQVLLYLDCLFTLE